MFYDQVFIGRKKSMFEEDIESSKKEIEFLLDGSSCLVVGGAGTIGGALTKELFDRNLSKLHVVDISENNLVELVRDIRSSTGYMKGEFSTFAIDAGSKIFENLVNHHGPYDYVFNLSALKHVRSEKDPYTLMRMIDVNIFNTLNILEICSENIKKYFCVSTDKATNPVNMMGASKRIMEMMLSKSEKRDIISSARFANVTFSDGSLLSGFLSRFNKNQPISAPRDVRRYFVSSKESGELCLMSSLFGVDMDIFFPILDQKKDPMTFSEIAKKYLELKGFSPIECESEDEARSRNLSLIKEKKWGCYFFESDTTGEKQIEEFFSDESNPNLDKFKKIGIVKPSIEFDIEKIKTFKEKLSEFKILGNWSKEDLVMLFKELIPEFSHEEKGKNLDQKM